MYHGGNNYGRGAAAGVTTKYADTANLYSDGLSNEPKRSHLRKLHETLISINHILLSHERQLHHAISLDKDKKGIQRAFLYGDKNNQVSRKKKKD
jgi:hypothetical protein